MKIDPGFAKERAVLITGCSSGIGHATAMYLAAQGFTVFATVRKEEDAEKLGEAGYENLIPVCPLDLTEPDHIAHVIEFVGEELEKRKLEGLYGYVNNAGGGFIAPLELMDIQKYRREVETRLVGPVALLQGLLPQIRKGHGRVIWIATPSLMPIPFDTSIHACDFAVNCISRTLHLELKPWGIPSIQIRCGCIDTAGPEKGYRQLEELRRHAGGRLGLYKAALDKTEREFREMDKKRSSPELIARTILKALAAEKPGRRYHAGYLSGLAAFMEYLPQQLTDHIMSKR